MAAHMEHQHTHSACQQMKQQLVHQPQLVVLLVTSPAGRHSNLQTVSLSVAAHDVGLTVNVYEHKLNLFILADGFQTAKDNCALALINLCTKEYNKHM